MCFFRDRFDFGEFWRSRKNTQKGRERSIHGRCLPHFSVFIPFISVWPRHFGICKFSSYFGKKPAVLAFKKRNHTGSNGCLTHNSEMKDGSVTKKVAFLGSLSREGGKCHHQHAILGRKKGPPGFQLTNMLFVSYENVISIACYSLGNIIRVRICVGIQTDNACSTGIV